MQYHFNFLFTKFMTIFKRSPLKHKCRYVTCSGPAVESRISVRVSPGWNRITSTMSLLVLVGQKTKTWGHSWLRIAISRGPRGYDVDSLEQECLGVHLRVGLARNVKLVGERERNLRLPHQLLVGVISRKRIFTWDKANESAAGVQREFKHPDQRGEPFLYYILWFKVMTHHYQLGSERFWSTLSILYHLPPPPHQSETPRWEPRPGPPAVRGWGRCAPERWRLGGPAAADRHKQPTSELIILEQLSEAAVLIKNLLCEC